MANIIQDFLDGSLLHRDYGFIPSRVERLYVDILQFDLQNLIEVPDGFVCVADLEILTDHPCDLVSRENAFFFLCSFLLYKDSFEISVDDLLETARCLGIKNLEVCLQLCPGVMENDVFNLATDSADAISLIHIIASTEERLAHEDTSLPKFIRQILEFLSSGQASSSSFSAPFFLGSCVSFHFFSGNCHYLWLSGHRQDMPVL